MKVLYVGDIHGDFKLFNQLINDRNPDIVIQVGDNAYYWRPQDHQGMIKPGNSKVYLLPGNHENWNKIEEIVGRRNTTPVEIEPNIFYCPIGSSITINDKRIVFIGGADSYDKEYRTLGINWWKEELLNMDDLDYVFKHNLKADILISHTCPKSFDVGVVENSDKGNDPTRAILDIVLEQLHPDKWFFGHWHRYKRDQYLNTDWMCLNAVQYKSFGRWWHMENI